MNAEQLFRSFRDHLLERATAYQSDTTLWEIDAQKVAYAATVTALIDTADAILKALDEQ